MNKEEFFKNLSELKKLYQDEISNFNIYQSVNCDHCNDCMFCNNCTYCSNCNYGESLIGCSCCTHCKYCNDCFKCSFSIHSEKCMDSAFLIYSNNCTECNYCFGCIGLVKKDFHILNKPYDRKTYFEITNKLKATLGI